ncbi:MAG TPA: hypothetical protein VGG71_03930 [Chitinophagaceae bacterium]
MKKPPLPVIIVSVLFILTGCIGFAAHIKDLFASNSKLYESIGVLLLETLAVACGFLLLSRINWARWLAIAWLACHIAISALNSVSQTIAHIVFFIVVTILLYLPVSSKYFHKKNEQ